MESRESILLAARRSYEWGRLAAALRVGTIIIPLIAIAALATAKFELCACVGCALLAVSVFFRWRDRRGEQAVEAGLRAGLVPLLIGVALRACAADCASPSVLPICVLGGLGAGWLLGSRLGALRVGLAMWGASVLVAALTASLGCVGFALGGLVGVMATLIVGSALVARLRSAH